MKKINVLNSVDYGRLEKWLGGKGKKILVYHRDADGICSAALLLKSFPCFRCIPREGPVIDKDFYGRLVKEEPDLLVFLDIPADQEWQKLLKIREALPGLDLAIIDHHTVEKDMNPEGMIHVNPRFLDEKYYIPAACVVYEMLEKMGKDVVNLSWISAVGVIGDYGFRDCHWVLKNANKEGHTTKKLVLISNMISSAITLKGLKGAMEALGILRKSETPEDFSGAGKMEEWNESVQKELRCILKDFEKEKEVFEKEKIILYELKNKLNTTSIIATITAEKYPDYIVIIRKKSGKIVKVSLRYQAGKLSVGKLAKRCSEGIGSGGGHIKSAGAITKDWEKFRKRAFDFLKEK